MKGTILDFSIGDSQGVISGDDGNRYKFVGKEWKSSAQPQAGLRVDYETEGRTALDIYFDRTSSTSRSSSLNIEDFYRSSDDKIFAGVCAGLAHKWNVNLPGLRFATFLVTLFFWLPLFVYTACWIIFPERPTKSFD